MALDTFPAIAPDYASGPVETKPRTLKSPFGDGYVQRSGDGLNNFPRTWAPTWTNITNSQADTIESFLRSKGGYTAFLCAATPNGASIKWDLRGVDAQGR